MATAVRINIGQLIELAIRKSQVKEASVWIRELISRCPGQAILFNSIAEPKNIAAVRYAIAYIVVSEKFSDEVKQKARIFLRTIMDVGREKQLELPAETIDDISAVENALSAF